MIVYHGSSIVVDKPRRFHSERFLDFGSGFLGVLDKDETIKRLKVEKLYDQVLFHTEKALSLCSYKEFIELEGEK